MTSLDNGSCNENYDDKLANFLRDNSIRPMSWRAIVVVTDKDQLMNCVLNGIMSRTDWPLAISVPLGIVPLGNKGEGNDKD